MQIEFVFQMRAAFVTLLASAGLGAELGREARSLDMVSYQLFYHDSNHVVIQHNHGFDAYDQVDIKFVIML